MDGFSLGPLSAQGRQGPDGFGEEKTPGQVQQGRFSLDDTCFQTDPFFNVIYYVLNSGGFTVDFDCNETI